MNQCDGCARGLPLENGIHRGEGWWDAIGCTAADRYGVAEPLVGDINAAFAAAEDARKSPDRFYLEGVAALVWRWREEAKLTEVAIDGGEIAAVLRECANELANSLPARLVSEAGKNA